MPFTPQELANIANAALDYYFERGKVFKQAIQKKPLIDKILGKARTFPGGKGDISIGVKGTYGAGGTNDSLKGFTHDDSVNFYTPANIDRIHFPWREMHMGWTMTFTELKHDGITVTNSTTGEGTSMHSNREKTVLAGLLEDKTEDFGEQYLRSLNNLFWGDGTSDAKGMQGITAFIVDDPTTGVCGGLDRSTKTWWRNRALVGANKITSSPASGGALMHVLDKEMRQLRRYGKGPDLWLAGSDFIDALKIEVRANGNFSMTGFGGDHDITVGGLMIPGLGKIQWDPWLDDNGWAKRSYMVDTSAIRLFKMENEWRKMHSPARPNDKFVFYRSLTCTGNMVTQQLNTSGVYEIA